MNKQSHNAMETRFDNLARVVRDWSDRTPNQPGTVPVWLLASAKAKQQAGHKPAFGRRRRLLGVTAFAVIAVIALTVLRGFGHSGPIVTFVVSEGLAADPASPSSPSAAATASIAGQVSSGSLPARLAFSDGSAVVLQPGARGTVVETTTRGARVRLDKGRAHFTVAHRLRTDWAVEAGPFVVIVHGTVFDVSWSVGAGALTVDLIAGSVTIEGPAAIMKTWGGHATLRAGQRLIARTSTGEGRVGPIESTPAEGDVPAVVAINAPVFVAAPAVPATQAVGNRDQNPVPMPIPVPVRTNDRTREEEETRSRRRAPPHAGSAAVAAASATWASRVASGSFQGVVADADALGIERCLSQASAGSLGALADAARYLRRTDLARRALLAERHRFEGSAGAHDAAFLIGRLAEDAAGDAREALVWYDRYLEEGPHGTYAAEALGRKMRTLDRLGEVADARSTAQRYLQMYPHGPFAYRAARLKK